jgi:hypothetical protein
MDPTIILIGALLIGAIIWIIASMGFIRNENNEDGPSLEQRVTTKDIAEVITHDAAFEVYFHSGSRPDLNDFHDESGDDLNYIRAIHNIKDPRPSSSALINTRPAMGGEVGRDTKYNTLFFGTLLDTPTVNSKWKSGREEMEIVHTAKKLRQYVDTPSQEAAYFLSIALIAPPELLQEGGPSPRKPRDYPALNIVGSRSQIYQTVQYLMNHPGKYKEFLSELLPRDQFPQVNAGILDHMLPVHELYFINTDTLDRKEVANRFGNINTGISNPIHLLNEDVITDKSQRVKIR